MTGLLNCSFITGTRLTEQERLIALIEKHASTSNRRVFHLDFEGDCYVVKMQQKKRSKIGYYILTMIAKYFPYLLYGAFLFLAANSLKTLK
ncbi:hypothetical protein MXE25_09120 [Legionella pneumophila]|nr:hypothetical protein [Legionella pneumophila]MCK1880024.1 hypothetical protein [Legionella pneumophila]